MPRQKVDLKITDKTELGYKTIIDNQYLGLIFHGDAFRPLALGECLPGYIKAIREDGKIDVIISQHSPQGDNSLEDQILVYLKQSGGESNLTDKSNPDHIYRQFKVSKKKYKNALGALYKRKLIVITREKISLVQANEKPEVQPTKSSSIWGKRPSKITDV